MVVNRRATDRSDSFYRILESNVGLGRLETLALLRQSWDFTRFNNRSPIRSIRNTPEQRVFNTRTRLAFVTSAGNFAPNLSVFIVGHPIMKRAVKR